SVTLAAWLLDERIHVYHLIGGLMVISGVILSQMKSRRVRIMEPIEKAPQA
ncbi:MAG: EamA family transporter, partial [Vibrionaceae bacterium]